MYESPWCAGEEPAGGVYRRAQKLLISPDRQITTVVLPILAVNLIGVLQSLLV